jgi:predicted esterase
LQEITLIARKLIARVFISTLLVTTPTLAAERLPSFKVDLMQTTVSGLSSGAFMALQFHVAYSGTVRGAGVVAGGPYFCAQGQLAIALTQCMFSATPPPNPARLVAAARRLAQENRIDRLENLADDRAYVFTGANDARVPSVVVDAARQFYLQAGLPAANLQYHDNLPAGHAMITENFGGACSRTGPPFINDCDFDLAGDILKHLYGALKPPAEQPGGRIVAFDQTEFFHSAPAPPRFGAGSPFSFPQMPGMGGDTLSLHHTGFAYVPASCAARESCRVHIVFHGCKQTPDDIGEEYVTSTGYNRWADSNQIIVLYPQIRHEFPANPDGCWDWFGYSGATYATKAGPQMAVVRAMLGRLGDE